MYRICKSMYKFIFKNRNPLLNLSWLIPALIGLAIGIILRFAGIKKLAE